MSLSLFSLLLCLPAPVSAAPGAGAAGRFLAARCQAEGQECGTSGSDGHFYGYCEDGLVCESPKNSSSELGVPSTCRKICGSFGPDGDHPTPTCSEGQTCSGKAATPCKVWAGECYMYCESADRRLDEEQPKSEGEQCGTSGSDGHFYGNCSMGLKCVPPADGAAPDTPSTCHKVCGIFGPSREKVFGTCSEGQTCSGKAATPCSARAGECYMYCAGADRRLAEQLQSDLHV